MNKDMGGAIVRHEGGSKIPPSYTSSNDRADNEENTQTVVASQASSNWRLIAERGRYGRR